MCYQHLGSLGVCFGEMATLFLLLAGRSSVQGCSQVAMIHHDAMCTVVCALLEKFTVWRFSHRGGGGPEALILPAHIEHADALHPLAS
jgi:hypothetical protein